MMSTQTSQTTKIGLKEAVRTIAQKIQGLERMIAPIGEPTGIHRIEVACEDIDILQWLEAQTSTTKFYFSNRQEEMEIGSIGIADLIDETTEKTIEEAVEAISLRFNFLNENVFFYGGVCFDKNKSDEAWKNFGQFKFFAPRFELRKTKAECTFACNIAYKDILEDNIKTFQAELEAINLNYLPSKNALEKPINRNDIPQKIEWDTEFARIMQAINNKTSEKIVLARKSIFEFLTPLNAFHLKRKLKILTPECYHFCFQIDPDNIFIGATPERLYKRYGTKIESEAIAGTKIKTAAKTTVDSSKNLREHNYVVKSLEQSFSSLCQTFKKDAKPSVLNLNWGEHLKTNFEGTLKEKITDSDIINAIHPTPAIAGYPQQKAIEMIKTCEPFGRGWYAGLIGFIGQRQAEFAVAIRSGLIQQNKISLFTGAGIIEESKADEEWDEIEGKMNNFFKAFNT